MMNARLISVLTVAVCGALPLSGALAGEGPAAAPPKAAAPASGPKVRQLSLEEAVKNALLNQERIAVSRYSYERSDAAVLEAWSGILPTLSATGSFTRSKKEPLPGPVLVPTSKFSNLYNGSVQVSQPLFTGGSVWNGVAASRSRRKAANEDVRTSREGTVFAASQDYYDAVLAQRVLAVVRNSYDLAKRHYEDQQAREKAGTASKFDVLRAKVAMQNQDAQVINADNSAQLSLAKLIRETGLPQETELELTTGFEKQVGPVPPLEEAQRIARERRPELASAKLSTRAQESSVWQARAGYLPKVSATASWGGSSVEDPTQDDNFTEGGAVGLQAQWNLFDGALTRARVAEAKADLYRLQWVQRGLQHDIELQVRQALLNLSSARNFIESQGANVEEAKEALRLADARQSAGTGTELDVQDARNALEQAQLNYVQSLYQYATARLALDQATGVLSSERK